MVTTYYSTYRLVVTGLYILVAGLLAAVAFSYSAVLGIEIALMLAVMGVIALWINFRGVELGLERNFGRYRNPMYFSRTYNAGLEIVDENYSGSPRPESFETADANHGTSSGKAFFVLCPFCHAAVADSNSRVCPDCGGFLRPPSGPNFQSAQGE